MHIQAVIDKLQLTEEPGVLASQSKSKFKDTFTKAVEVFFGSIITHEDVSSDAFILSTGLGNSENILRLINNYRNKKFVSAQLFPEATMSSASVNINRIHKIHGGNITANIALSINDALLLAMLDAVENNRSIHVIHGEVNALKNHHGQHNYLLYMKVSPCDIGTHLSLRADNKVSNIKQMKPLSLHLKDIMSPALFDITSNQNTYGEVADVYLN
jgi:hypothetical protein